MDPQIFELINERSDRQDKTLDEIKDLLAAHIEKDEKYWKRIDVAEGQIDLLRWLFGGGAFTAIGSALAWVITNIKG